MSVAIRLTRTGTVKKAHWRIVATRTLTKRDGRFIENLGHYHPGKTPAQVEVNESRLKYWVEHGAIVSVSVANLLKKKGIRIPKRS